MILQNDILKIAASCESYRIERTISTKDTDKSCNMFSRGVGRVQEMLHENGNGDAIFDLDKITVFNVIIKENPEDAALAAAQTRGEKPSEKTPLKTPLKTPGKIIDLILAEPTLSLPEIALAVSKSESAVKRAI
jgi:ATP-dependent DNA helicase RecG